MGRVAAALVALTSLLTALAVSGHTVDASGGGSATVDAAYVEQVMFDVSIGDFAAIQSGRVGPDGVAGDTWFDWSNDGCSAPLIGNTGRSFDFTGACRRHDFGYRNTRLLDARYGSGTYWNAASRRRIDRRFLSDMKHHCRHRRLIDRPTCYSWAYTFYSAVRVGGGL